MLAAIVLVALLTACAHVDGGQPAATLVVERDNTAFIVVGDWGNYGNSHQRRVAKQMNAFAAQHPVDFIVSTGDNIYDKGVQGVDDPLFKQTFEGVYSLQHLLPLHWYLVLGNHDYQGSYLAQIEYSGVNPRWHMPATYHSLVVRFDDHRSAALLFLDTNAFSTHYRKNPQKYVGIDEQDTEAQLAWFEAALVTHGDATWRIAVGHHPVYSAGKHTRRNRSLEPLVELMERHDVRAYFAGHDHDLQHLRPPGVVEYIISGAGAKLRPIERPECAKFAVSQRGFVYVTLDAEQLTAIYVNIEGEEIYRLTAPADAADIDLREAMPLCVGE